MCQEETLRKPGQVIYAGKLIDSDFDGRGAGEYYIRELRLLTKYLGTPTLGEGLFKAGVKRCLEVGVGRGFSLDYSPIAHLARLHFKGQQLFTTQEVLAIDPNIRPDCKLIEMGRLDKEYKDLYVRIPSSIEEIEELVREKCLPPFDLITSTGVIAVGSTMFGVHDKEEYDKGLALIEAMRNCLNPRNPNSMIALFDYFTNRMIPIAPSHLADLGLKVVYGKQSTSNEAAEWQGMMKHFGLVSSSEEIFYSEMICQIV